MMRNIAKFAAAAVLVGAMATSSFAQESNDIIRPITKMGSAAMVFNLNGLGTFGLGGPSINGVPGAGIKYFIGDDVALRILLGAGVTSEGNASAATNPTPEHSVTNIGIGAGLEYHFRPLYSTSPYVGAQVLFATTTTKDKAVGATQESKDSRTGFGIGAFAGFDWFFTRGLAVGGEYQLNFVSSSHSVTAGTTTDYPSSTEINLNGTGNVHLVVYF